MITSITSNQSRLLDACREKWIAKGLSTTPATLDDAVRIKNGVYKFLGKSQVPVAILNNPIEAWAAVCLFGISRNQVESQVGSQVESQVESQVRSQVESQSVDFIWPWLDGKFYASYCSYLDAFINVFKLRNIPDVAWFLDCANVELIYPLDNICIMSNNFTKLHKNEKGLHNFNGAAVEYASGYKIYAMNGVIVPEWLAETPAYALSFEEYAKITNADIKAEFVKKAGIERLISCGKEIDTYKNYNNEWWNKSEYRLIDMSSVLQGFDYAPHLLMVNQTTKTFHLEGVTPNCKTLIDAFKMRERDNYADYQILDIK